MKDLTGPAASAPMSAGFQSSLGKLPGHVRRAAA
jgi:hypothetical protein